jgi:hypothetical protein
MLRFRCPHCHSAFVVPVGSEGLWVQCRGRNCNQSVQVANAEPAAPEDWPALAHVRVLWDCLRWGATPRKARLFACACLRRLDHLLESDYRQALRAYERFAEGLLTIPELEAATEPARRIPVRPKEWSARVRDACLAVTCVLRATSGDWTDQTGKSWADVEAVWHAVVKGLETADHIARWAHEAEHRAQCALLRDIFGGQFTLTPPEARPEWFEYNGGLVTQVARGIYDERQFEDLPILADALEEAGCQVPLILDHCREVGEHVRGCWVVDLALGRT